MPQLSQDQPTTSTKPNSELVKFGSLGVYAEDSSQAWGVILTFFTLFIWFVYLNNELGDQIFRSIITVILFTGGTLLIYKFWTICHRKLWKKIRPK